MFLLSVKPFGWHNVYQMCYKITFIFTWTLYDAMWKLNQTSIKKATTILWKWSSYVCVYLDQYSRVSEGIVQHCQHVGWRHHSGVVTPRGDQQPVVDLDREKKRVTDMLPITEPIWIRVWWCSASWEYNGSLLTTLRWVITNDDKKAFHKIFYILFTLNRPFLSSTSFSMYIHTVYLHNDKN